jgi:nitrogenase molybdenum-iron protein alpha/beta subunit
MDENDYINGAEEKIEEILPIIRDVDGGIAVFIKSPGAALIGDNITDMIERLGYADSAMAIEESLISQPFSTSYDHTVKAILEWRSPNKTTVRPGTVNILGLPITTKAWADSLDDLRTLLSLCGIEVVSTPGAGCGVSDLDNSVNAEYNVIVCPEYGSKTAEHYREKYGIPYIKSPSGAPVGFDATEDWIKNIAVAMGKDPSVAIEHINDCRRRAFRIIDKLVYNQKTKCCRFAVVADSSIMLPLTKWLYQYLCMIPVFLDAEPGEDKASMDALNAFIDSSGLKNAVCRDITESDPYFVFADGHMAETMKLMGSCKVGVDISAPNLSNFSFIPKPVLGALGSMYILDEIFNGL